MSTENIVKFLQSAYSDEKLAALLAHAQDGKLAFYSCCCLAGFTTADHAYCGEMPLRDVVDTPHYSRMVKALGGDLVRVVENEFKALGETEAERRERIIPLVLAEMKRRELLRTLPDLPLSEQLRLEEEAAAEEGAAIEASGYPDPASDRSFA